MKNRNLSSISRRNLCWLVGLLQDRLRSRGQAKATNPAGLVTYVDTDIYSVELLESFICLSLSEFNMVPYFTFFTLEDSNVIDTFAEIIVEGATLYALASQALIERGREFTITDDGMTTEPPNVSEMLNTQYSVLLSHHWEKLKHIKAHITEFKK